MTTGIRWLGTCKTCNETKLLEVVRKQNANGSESIGAWCPDCGLWGRLHNQAGTWIPKAHVSAIYDRLRIVESDRPQRECDVEGCGNVGTEIHHWAPRAYFGHDSARWPKAHLCRVHHAEWHAIVTPALVRSAA